MVEIHKGLVFSFSSFVGVKFFLSRAKEYHIKTAKHTRRIMPSILLSEVSAPLKKLNERIVSRIDTPIHKGSSNFRFLRSTAMGKNSAVSPKMLNTLKMLDPTTLPIATSELPLRAPKKLTMNSGIDVPTPTIAAPITKSETLYFRAIDTAPVTKKSAPNTIPTKEARRVIYSILT